MKQAERGHLKVVLEGTEIKVIRTRLVDTVGIPTVSELLAFARILKLAERKPPKKEKGGPKQDSKAPLMKSLTAWFGLHSENHLDATETDAKLVCDVQILRERHQCFCYRHLPPSATHTNEFLATAHGDKKVTCTNPEVV